MTNDPRRRRSRDRNECCCCSGEGIPPAQGGPDPRVELKPETENGGHQSSHAILPAPPFP